MNKILYIIRGVSGSGKTTLANTLAQYVFSGDDYFTDKDGNYKWDGKKLHLAHKTCQNNVESHMKSGVFKIAVANTFVKPSEWNNYTKLAEQYGYTVFHIITENRHGGENVHNVPEETLKRQERRFDIKLR